MQERDSIAGIAVINVRKKKCLPPHETIGKVFWQQSLDKIRKRQEGYYVWKISFFCGWQQRA
ncbi:MAG: hypothetical protein PHZ05_04360, partial [Pygmaiobacter massiliensis]|nr:hypothetical protein [Pygmaiobacter massiliensis]